MVQLTSVSGQKLVSPWLRMYISKLILVIGDDYKICCDDHHYDYNYRYDDHQFEYDIDGSDYDDDNIDDVDNDYDYNI